MGSSQCLKKPFLPQSYLRLRCLPPAFINSLAFLVVAVLIFEFGAFSAGQFRPLLVFKLPTVGDDAIDEAMKETINELKQRVENLQQNLRDSVTFLPLVDMRYESTASWSNAWFMSSFDKELKDPNGFMNFPSNSSKGRVLCVVGKNQTDGRENGYALAWKHYLPSDSTLLPGLTFIAENYYTYQNIWHCLDALAPFLLWSKRNQYAKPDRFVLYRKGELVHEIISWTSMVLLSAVGYQVPIEKLDYGDIPVCFERAVVNPHGISRFNLETKSETFDIIRQTARRFCNVTRVDGLPTFNFTLFTRTGARSFKNESAMSSTFENECNKVPRCRFRNIRTESLSFCDQVSIMTTTQVLATAHGAQLTNIVFMEKGSHIMEMYPKGWLELAGPGQYLYRWLSDWIGLIHEGSWHDPEGPECPNPEKGWLHCFFFFKDRQVGFNYTKLSMWATEVLRKVEVSKPMVSST